MAVLRCPADRKNSIKVDPAVSDLSKSFNGVITCKNGHEFVIEENIIDLLPGQMFPGGSIANFSNHFSLTALSYEEQWRKRSIGWLSGQDFTLQDEADLLLNWIGDYSKKVVIDIGASTGFYSRTVASTHPDSEIYAIDFSRPMLKETVKKAAAEKRRLFALRADVTRLPFFDDSADLALCGGTYNELYDPETSMKQIFRVLNPGGVCFIMYLTKAQSYAGRMFQLGLRTGGVSFPKRSKVENQFTKCGFDILKTRTVGIVTFQLLQKTA